MSTLAAPDIPLDAAPPAQRLRRTAAAVRLHFTWWGVHKTLTARQREEVGAAYAADARFLTAGKRLVDTRHGAFRRLTAVRTRAAGYWRGLTPPHTQPRARLPRPGGVGGARRVRGGRAAGRAGVRGRVRPARLPPGRAAGRRAGRPAPGLPRLGGGQPARVLRPLPAPRRPLQPGPGPAGGAGAGPG